MPPSGEQVELRHGDQRAVVVEAGGGLRSYDVHGAAVLDGYADDEMASDGRGQVLAPWPNRLLGGRYTWDGSELAVPLDEPAKGAALHGLTRWRSWQPVRRESSAVTMRLLLLPQPGYPFALDLAVQYELAEEGLTVTTSATNVGRAAAPYGSGAHPYLTVGTTTIDGAVLLLPAQTWLPAGADGAPSGRAPVEGTAVDFRSPRPLGDLVVDHTFTDLRRGPDGRAEVQLTDPDSERRVTLWLDEGYPYLQVYSGDDVSTPSRRRGGLGVEPMTCPPDAFRSGQGVLRLAPGTSVTHRWGLRPR